MLPHVLPTVFVTHRYLHPTCQPAHVVRSDGATLVMLDARSLRVELAFWALDNLTAAERMTIRAACGLDPDLSQRIPDEILDGELGSELIALPLRLPDLTDTLTEQTA